MAGELYVIYQKLQIVNDRDLCKKKPLANLSQLINVLLLFDTQQSIVLAINMTFKNSFLSFLISISYMRTQIMGRLQVL